MLMIHIMNTPEMIHIMNTPEYSMSLYEILRTIKLVVNVSNGYFLKYRM